MVSCILSDPSWLQAIASIVLAIITLIYVILTWRLLHAPHTAHLQPHEIRLDRDDWIIEIKNYGPGLATTVRVQVRVHIDITWAPTDARPQRVFTTVDWQEAAGPTEVHVGETAHYRFETRSLPLTFPVVIRWETVIGRKRKDMWFYQVGFNSRFVTRDGLHWIKYLYTRCLQSAMSPWHALQRKRYLKNAKPKKAVSDEDKSGSETKNCDPADGQRAGP